MWPEVENQRWRPLNFQNVYHSLYPRYQPKFNGYTYDFGVQLSNKDSSNVVRSTGKKPEVDTSRWRPLNFDYVYLSLYTRLHRNFNGHTYVIGVQLSNKDSDNVVRSTEKPTTEQTSVVKNRKKPETDKGKPTKPKNWVFPRACRTCLPI